MARRWPLARPATALPAPVRHLLQHRLHSGGLTSGLCVGWQEADSHKAMEETLTPAGDGTDDGLKPTAGVAGDCSESAVSFVSQRLRCAA